jgi:hypothetical protein
VPFPFVAVTLPPDTPPAYVAALLESCTQAYVEGECRSSVTTAVGPLAPSVLPSSANGEQTAASGASTVSPPETTSNSRPSSNSSDPRILATVEWSNALRAELVLGLPYWLNSRWIEWHLDFKEHDQLLERHRAVGFALGRLAVTVADVARREHEVALVESKVEPKPGPPPATPIPTPPPGANAPKPPTWPKPAPITDDLSRPDGDVAQTYTPTSVYAAPLLGAELGTGLRGVRIGGTAGADLVFANRFALGLRGYLTGDSLHATFAGAELRIGMVWEPDPIELQLNVGAGWNYVSARVDRSASEHVVGGVANFGIALSRRAISPFLGLGASFLQEGVDTNVANSNAYGPVVPRLQFGFKLRPDLF